MNHCQGAYVGFWYLRYWRGSDKRENPLHRGRGGGGEGLAEKSAPADSVLPPEPT